MLNIYFYYVFISFIKFSLNILNELPNTSGSSSQIKYNTSY